MKWRVSVNLNENPSYLIEADSPEQAVEEAKELWREQADELHWEIEQGKES
jgi:hypothetical protein